MTGPIDVLARAVERLRVMHPDPAQDAANNAAAIALHEYSAAVAELIAADDEYDAAHKELIRRVAEQGWYEIEFDALRNAGVRTIRAQARRAAARERLGGAA